MTSAHHVGRRRLQAWHICVVFCMALASSSRIVCHTGVAEASSKRYYG